MASFGMHVFLVAACIGLGYVLRIMVENMTALDAQVERMIREARHVRDYVSGYPASQEISSAQKPNLQKAMGEVKLKADPDKMAKLRAAIKG